MQRHSLEFYRSIVGNSMDLVSVIDAEGKFLFVGESVKTVLGYEVEELEGASAYSFIHPDDLPDVLATMAELLTSGKGKSALFRHKSRDKGWRWIECNATNMLENEHVQGIMTSSRDVTEARQLLYEKEYHQAYYESLFFEHPHAVFTLHTSGKFRQVNQHMETITGYSEHEALTISYSAMVHPDSLAAANEAFQKVLAGKALTDRKSVV